MIHLILGVLLFVGIGYPWLLGNWVVATLMSIAFLLPAVMMIQAPVGLAVTAIGYAIIWAPILVRMWLKGATAPVKAS